MNLHLKEIGAQVASGAHVLLVCDGAGWHQRGKKKRFAIQNRADTAREVNMWESRLSSFDAFVNGPDNFFKSH